jgi:hypothetical protein
MTHWDYFKNTMFGPNCQSSECLGTVFSAILAGSIAYSVVAYCILRFAQRESISG